MIWLTKQQKDKIIEMMNPPGHNYKQCNFFKVLHEIPAEGQNQAGYHVEVGYWITYIGCRPKYEKTTIFFPK